MKTNLFHSYHSLALQLFRRSKIAKRLIIVTLLVFLTLFQIFQVDASNKSLDEPVSELSAEKLTAFARMYGYVRFFHPSDQASLLDWNQMALYGADQVLNSNDSETTRQLLKRLFGPVVENLEFYAGEEKKRPETIAVDSSKMIAWQHVGVGLGSKGSYSSKRTNRKPVPFTSLPVYDFGNIVQNIDAKPLRGKKARFRFKARVVDSSVCRLNGWWRVDCESNKRGLSDNMHNRPILEQEWTEYELSGVIDDDAEKLSFGVMMHGVGSGLVDEVTIEVRNNDGNWSQVNVENPSFETGEEAPDAWFLNTGTGSFKYVVDKSDKTHGEQSIRVSFTGNDSETPVENTLFSTLPKLGEVVDHEIGHNLRFRMPLALPVTHQYSSGDDSSVDKYIRKVKDFASNEHAVIATANVVIIWNVMQHFYPYFDQIETNWDHALDESIHRAVNAKERKDVTRTLQWLVAQLHDGHGNVYDKDLSKKIRYLPVSFDWIENSLVVVASREPSILPGDIITKIDGQDSLERIMSDEQYISGSPQWKRCIATKNLSHLLDSGSSVLLEIERDGRVWEESLKGTSKRSPEPSKLPKIDTIEDGGEDGAGAVFYVDLGRVRSTDIDSMIEKFSNAKGIIFDLRGYPKGTHYLFQHFTDKHLQSAQWLVSRQVYPDRVGMDHFEKLGRWEMPPREPVFKGKKVFITNKTAISYAESCMAIIANYKLAPIVGSSTAGANGNINPFSLPGRYRVLFTGMRVINHDNSQHHTLGVQPTIPLEPTVEGVRNGRDELLERAISLINE